MSWAQVYGPYIAAAGVLASTHVVASHLHQPPSLPRSRWLSAGGGVSVAYVFLHLLPELGTHQRVLADATQGWLDGRGRHVYLMALLGLAVFHGLESLTLRDRRRRSSREGGGSSGIGTFLLGMGMFALYNALIGYLLLAQARAGAGNLLSFTAAMGLHLAVNDYALQQHHRERYRRQGRWLLAVAVLVGAGMAASEQVPAPIVSAVAAFVAGGVILNVLKEELPAERESRFAAFALGAFLNALLLLSLD